MAELARAARAGRRAPGIRAASVGSPALAASGAAQRQDDGERRRPARRRPGERLGVRIDAEREELRDVRRHDRQRLAALAALEAVDRLDAGAVARIDAEAVARLGREWRGRRRAASSRRRQSSLLSAPRPSISSACDSESGGDLLAGEHARDLRDALGAVEALDVGEGAAAAHALRHPVVTWPQLATWAGG